MAAHYTRTANRARLSKGAAEKLKSIPAQPLKVRGETDNLATNQQHNKMLVGEEEVKSSHEINIDREK